MGVARATIRVSPQLPAVMGEGLVGLGHAVRVLALPDSRSPVLGGIHQLVRQAERHGLLAAVTGCVDDPAHRQCLAASRPNFNWYLIGGAADPAGLHLDHGLDVIEGRGEDLDGLAALLAGLLGNTVEGTINDALSSGLLAAFHDDIHELSEHLVVVLRVREDGADRGLGSARHGLNTPYFFGRLAPYLERLCLRSLTPAQSSVPRTVW